MQTMNLSSSHLLLPALEGRTRAYVKMGELKLALKDAREMIQTAPEKVKVRRLLYCDDVSIQQHLTSHLCRLSTGDQWLIEV